MFDAGQAADSFEENVLVLDISSAVQKTTYACQLNFK
jgi:hypothetical protein